MCELIQTGKPLNDWFKNKTDEEKSIINEYVEFLCANEYVIDCDSQNINSFQKLNMNYETPEVITAVNLTYDSNVSSSQMKDILRFFISNHVKNLSLFYTGDVCELTKILDVLKDTYLNNIELYLSFNDFSEYKLEDIISEHSAILKVVFLGADCDSHSYLDNGKQISKYTSISKNINPLNSPMHFRC